MTEGSPDVPSTPLAIGVDVGGTFTDLVWFDGARLGVVKIPSTPPHFERAVIEAVKRAGGNRGDVQIVHGSTVATNALLERKIAPVAFITTEGFRDMLLIGRQNRPELYALHVARPRPLSDEANWFAAMERMDAKGGIVEPLDDAQLEAVIATIKSRGIGNVAVCLLFSYVNPIHEQTIAECCRRAGLTVSLSSDILPEFREYERASTTVMNAALRPVVEQYLTALESGLTSSLSSASVGPPVALEIMSSTGGTLSVADASASAARLVLSGPAGGVMGALLIAKAAGIENVITYDMGGTSTDVATIVGGRPQWTTSSSIDGLPIGLPALDIHTVGAGGGSLAYLDAGGALRVGPKSAGAFPGPACYGRGGSEPTVTDANLVLGRLLPERFAGGHIQLNPELARKAIHAIAAAMGKTIEETAAGIVRIAEEKMSRAIRAVTSRRGLDPKDFALMSFGGAGGLHACALAESLEIPRVVIPPYCGVLSALGMVAATRATDVSKTVLHLADELDDHRLYAEYGYLNMLAAEKLPNEQLAAIEAFAEVRFKGQSYEVTVQVKGAERVRIEEAFRAAYVERYGRVPEGRAIEIVTLRLRRIGIAQSVELPDIEPESANAAFTKTRGDLLTSGAAFGPFLLVDPEATTYIPNGWRATCDRRGIVVAWASSP